MNENRGRLGLVAVALVVGLAAAVAGVGFGYSRIAEARAAAYSRAATDAIVTKDLVSREADRGRADAAYLAELCALAVAGAAVPVVFGVCLYYAARRPS